LYFRIRRQLADNTFGEPRFATRGLAAKPLRFLNLDRFQFNKHSLTPRLNQMVDHLARHVSLSWNTDKPISVIRLIGHTDSTGDEKKNVQLGDKRAEAIRAALQSGLKSFMDRVLIVVEPGPGETEPTASNGTMDGRSRNRRVEVFVTFGVAPPPSPPRKICIEPWRCVKDLPPESVIITKPGPYGTAIPAGRVSKSVAQLLDEKLSRLPRWLSWPIKKAVIEGSCMSLEMALGKVVGELSEGEKDELRRQCSDRAKKPM
jgi:outer membrane protein OmpA-like peptidoglycan-associated protein